MDQYKHTKDEFYFWYVESFAQFSESGFLDDGFSPLFNSIRDGTLPESKDTVLMVAKKYKEYYDAWLNKWGNADAQFIPKEERLIPVVRFIENKMYRQDFGLRPDDRYTYLFGEQKFTDVIEKFKRFKNLIKSPWIKQED